MAHLPPWVRDHSLSLALLVLGVTLTGLAIALPEGKAFDLVSGFGLGFLLGALINLMSGPLRERNRPDQ